MFDTVESSQSESPVTGDPPPNKGKSNPPRANGKSREGERSRNHNVRSPKEPPFPFDDEDRRRAWLWKLLYKCCQERAADSAKVDTRFVVHLSTMLELSGSSGKSEKAGSTGDLATFLESMSPETFAEYKQLG